jgi:uncharacterized protein
MGNCANPDFKDSLVSLMQKGDSVKSLNMLIEYQDLFKPGSTINCFGDTALHYAAAMGNTDIVRWLCSHEADINAENHHGWTPLDSAYFCKKTDTIEFLKSAGANFKYFNQARKTN